MKYLFALFLVLFVCGCSSKVAVVKIANNEALLSENGEVITNAKYEMLFKFNDKFYKTLKNGKFGIIKVNAEEVLKPIYDSISNEYNGHAIIELNGKFGLVDSNFDERIKPQYEYINDINDNFLIVKYKKVGCVDYDNNILLDYKYDMIYPFHEGLARVENGGKFGFIDESCQEVVKPIYDYAGDFYNGYAKIKLNDKYSFINRNTEKISEVDLDNVENFKGNY
ncbi:MAG: WG repeat-containing protein [Candidatus Marinarcus sp.]|uniref:WG repeat-containing protein n=1 Tax=Candidatus Marinarcus sp. TaxID=3100987 RepID=UPI003AFFF33B